MHDAHILHHHGNNWCSQIRVSTLQQWYFIHSPYPTKQADAVFFGPDTYRFTHALNQHFASNPAPVLRAIDICTGCGPGAILIANTFPKAEVYGVDINATALEFARFNANFNGIFNASGNSSPNHLGNLSFVNSNLLHAVEGEFDFITANPPFLVDASQRTYRHGGGVYGYQLALDIIDAALARLSSGGTLLLYTGVAIVNGEDLFLTEVKAKLDSKASKDSKSSIESSAFSYSYQEIDPDIFAEELLTEPYLTADRIAAVVLVVKKHHSSKRMA